MDLHDDVLGLVLKRVGSHVSLIRAAAVCRRWRRVIAGAAFLRRFRSLHAPAVAGEYRNSFPLDYILMGGEDAGAPRPGPVFLPSSPSMVDARHFSLDFLPGGARSWIILDTRGSLLLAGRTRSGRGLAPRGMVVCEPLTRRCEIIPPPPDFKFNGHGFMSSCLVDGYAKGIHEAGGHISMSNFKVLSMFMRDGVMHAAIFTVSSSCSNKIIDHIAPSLQWPDFWGRAGGSWYFYLQDRRILVELDGPTGDSTSSVLPAIEGGCSYSVTQGRDGKPRFFTVLNDTMKVFAKLRSGEWGLENSVLLSEATRGMPGYQPSFFSCHQEIFNTGTGFVTLRPQQFGEQWSYSINLETMEAKFPSGDTGRPMEYLYELPWPPALHACAAAGGRRARSGWREQRGERSAGVNYALHTGRLLAVNLRVGRLLQYIMSSA